MAEVRSLTQPLGEPPPAKPGLASLLNSAVQSAGTRHYLSRRSDEGRDQFTTRLDIGPVFAKVPTAIGATQGIRNVGVFYTAKSCGVEGNDRSGEIRVRG